MSAKNAALEAVTELTNAKPADSLMHESHKGIASPASEPKAASALPATGESRPRQKPIIAADVRDPDIAFPTGDTLFPGHSEEYIAKMLAQVRCHVVESFGGTLKNAYGSFQKFSFTKHEVVLLPRWFALEHPTRLVIKE